MNYLAHLTFSIEDTDLTIGNFIADAVKGKQYRLFPDGVQKGILLHRFIDTFTDGHPVAKTSRKRFLETQGKWAGVVTDVVYDHFLAIAFAEHTEMQLQAFASDVYLKLSGGMSKMPARSQRFLHYMVSNNILVRYKDLSVVGDVLFGMDQRTKYPSGMVRAIEVVEREYEELQNDFAAFFVDLKSAIAKWKIHELENHRIG